MVIRKVSVWSPSKKGLGYFKDDRGEIADVFYNENINHVAIISSKKGSIRGNHYHKLTVQHTLVIKGKMQYWYKSLDPDSKALSININAGEMVTSLPNQIHALMALEDNECLVFTEGVRGGHDYEKDTYRVKKSIVT